MPKISAPFRITFGLPNVPGHTSSIDSGPNAKPAHSGVSLHYTVQAPPPSSTRPSVFFENPVPRSQITPSLGPCHTPTSAHSGPPCCLPQGSTPSRTTLFPSFLPSPSLECSRVPLFLRLQLQYVWNPMLLLLTGLLHSRAPRQDHLGSQAPLVSFSLPLSGLNFP